MCLPISRETLVAPNNNSTDFINRKGQHSTNLLACANYNSFFDVVMKRAGSVHDARIWWNSSINPKFKNWEIPQNFKVIVDSKDLVPVSCMPTYWLFNERIL